MKRLFPWSGLRALTLGTALACTLGLAGQAAQAQGAPAETLAGGLKLPADASERLYVMDAVFNHLSESRVNVFDGATGKFLGMVPTAYNGHMMVSQDGAKIYVMTTYHSRMTRGERTDVVEVWDAHGLTFEKEIILPARRVQGLNYRGMFRQSTDGNFIALQNATPAVSTTVVDLRSGQATQEITATAGCWSVIPKPNKPRSFISICGDGALLTLDLDEHGKLASQSRSKTMFPVGQDPIFIAPALEKTQVHFVSYNGNVYTADFSGDDMRFEAPWSLLDDKDKAEGWRPGGYNLIDIHRPTRRLYVLMHPKGAEGTHKNPAAEIWVYDMATKKRLARVPGQDALSISVAQGKKPRLLTLDGGNAHVYDISGNAPKLLRSIEGAAESALQIEPQPIAGAING